MADAGTEREESLFESFRKAWEETAGDDFSMKLARGSLMAVAPGFAARMQEEDIAHARIDTGQWAYGTYQGLGADTRVLVEWNGLHWLDVRSRDSGDWFGLTELIDIALVQKPLDPKAIKP